MTFLKPSSEMTLTHQLALKKISTQELSKNYFLKV
jgi:hypothetical protein